MYSSKSHAETPGSFTSSQLILGNGGDEYSTEPLLRKGTEKYRIAYTSYPGTPGSPTYTSTVGQDVPSSGLRYPENNVYYTTATFTPYGSNEEITVYRLQTGTEEYADDYKKAAEVMDMNNLPSASVDSAAWFVNPDNGKIYLIFKEEVVPQWMTSDGSTDISEIEDPTLVSFIGFATWQEAEIDT